MKRKSVVKFLLFASAFALFPIVKIIASSLGGPSSYFAYEPYHHVFYDRESAIGYVRLCNGFTVTRKTSGVGFYHNSIMFMDTNLSVSGAIDLRETNTLFLQQDLRLENGVTFSSGGNIYGYDKALILYGDLQIQANKVLHFGGRILIEGNGHTLKINDNAQIFVDTSATLTLRNLVVKNSKNFVGNPAIKVCASTSKLALDNTILNIVGDFYFDCGSMFIHNDVAFTGTSAFVYRSSWPSYITSGATLNFDAGTTFDFRPSTTGTPALLPKDLLNLVDATSQLYLNGCTVKATTTGLRLTEGQLLLENKVSLTSNTQFDISGYQNGGSPIAQTTSYGVDLDALDWRPDGRFLAVTRGNTVYAVRFDGSSLTNVDSTASYGDTVYAVAWRPDGKYFAIGGAASTNLVWIYSFNGNTLTSVGGFPFTGGTDIRTLKWSPDGRYLAVGGSTTPYLQVYAISLDGATTRFALVAQVSSGGSAAVIRSISWHPSGNYIAIGESAGTSTYRAVNVHLFTGRSLSLVASRTQGNNNVYSVAFSPDGNYVAFGVDTVNTVGVYQFTGSSLVTAAVTPVNYGGQVNSIAWSPCGRYLVVGGATDQTVKIYQFMNGVLTLVGTSANYGGVIYGVTWSPDCRYVAACGYTTRRLNVYQPSLIYNGQQAISNSIVFGNSALGSAYDLDVKFLSNSNVELDGLIDYDNVN